MIESNTIRGPSRAGMKGVKKRTGRPTGPAHPGRRASLGLKVTPEIKALLDSAAKQNGRTQSQEAEARLERTFQEEQLLPQLLELRFGQRLAEVLLLLAEVIQDAGTHAVFRSRTNEHVAGQMDSWAFFQGMDAALASFEVLRPPGEPNSAEMHYEGAWNLVQLGWAAGALQAIAHPDLGGPNVLVKDESESNRDCAHREGPLR